MKPLWQQQQQRWQQQQQQWRQQQQRWQQQQQQWRQQQQRWQQQRQRAAGAWYLKQRQAAQLASKYGRPEPRKPWWKRLFG